MKKIIIIFLLLPILIISCKENVIKEYKNGVLYKLYTLDDNDEYNGVYKEFYNNGNVKVIHNFQNGVLIDSSTSYNTDSSLLDIRFYNKKDTVFCKTFKNNTLESSGEAFKTRKIGYWNYYNEDGRIIKKQQFINLCGKHYVNQSWEYDKNNSIIKNKGNYYKVILEKKEYSVGEKIDIKIIYTPLLGTKSKNLICTSTKISDDFCNIKDVKLDYWHSDNREITIKLIFSTKGNKNLRGYIQEYLYKEERPINDKYLYREVYFDIFLHIR
ncbi:hypothetical protein ACWA1F_00635 [Flavobacterium sp. 3-218]